MDGSSLLFVIRSSLLNRGEGEVPTSFTSPKSVVNSEADDGRKERVSGRLRGASIMMGTKERSFAPLITMSLEELVPQDHFYRHLERTLDLSFVREFVQEKYAGAGRPSIDPVVFFKLQLVMFFEGIRSERLLMRHAAQQNAERHDWIEELGAQDRRVTSGNYQPGADLRVSTTDPDATIMLHKDGSHLGYQTRLSRRWGQKSHHSDGPGDPSRSDGKSADVGSGLP
jgi:hypothetical protein